MSNHLRIKQLSLLFLEKQTEETKAREAQYTVQFMKWRYPMTPEEKAWLPKEVRLARFVPFTQCEHCHLATEDHTQGRRFLSTVCLADLREQGII